MSKASQPDKQNGTLFADPIRASSHIDCINRGRTQDCTRPIRQIIKSNLQRGSHPHRTFGYYHGNRYVVRDWQHYHLCQPSYGYEWVQDGDQFVLIAIATGIVTDVILNAMNQ